MRASDAQLRITHYGLGSKVVFAGILFLLVRHTEDLFAATAIADSPGETVKQVGKIVHPDLKESSGLVVSRQYREVFWTHNDGPHPTLYAIRRDGSSIAEFAVEGATFEDWEDIAIDAEKHLYLADTGNNKGTRPHLNIHQIDEPDPAAAVRSVKVTRTWQVRYAAAPRDFEGLFIWKGFGYLVAKLTDDQKAELFRFPLSDAKMPVNLKLVARLDVTSPVAGADISSDGRLLALVAQSGAFVFRIEGDVARAGSMKPERTRFRHEEAEGCCFVPEGLLVCAESREIYLFIDPIFRVKQ